MINQIQANFNGGEVTPLMDARVDSAKYSSGCRILQNFIVRPYGGVFRRPGTEFCGFAKSNTQNTRLISFRRSTEVNLALEMGDRYIRFWRDVAGVGKPLVASGAVMFARTLWVTGQSYSVGTIRHYNNVSYQCTQAHTAATNNRPGDGTDGTSIFWSDYWQVHYLEAGTLLSEGGNTYYCRERHSPGSSFAGDSAYWYQLSLGVAPNNQIIYEVPTPWTQTEIFDLQVCQINDVLILTHPNHHPLRLTRHEELRWVLEPVPFDFAPTLDVNESSVNVQVQYDVDEWVTGIAYAKGTRVIGDNGVLYTCYKGGVNSTTTNKPSLENTASIAIWNRGSSGEAIPKWAAGKSYPAGAKVRYGKGIFQSRKSHTSTAAVQGRYGLVGGNEPVRGQTWTSFWTRSEADTDLSGIDFKLVATGDVFTEEDVGNIWRVDVGTSGLYAKLATTATAVSEEMFFQGDFLLTTNWAQGYAMIGTIFVEESLDGVTWQKIRSFVTSDNHDGNISWTGETPAAGAWYRINVEFTSGGAGATVRLEPATSVLALPFKIESNVYNSGVLNKREVKGSIIMPSNSLPPPNAIGVSTSIFYKPAFSAQDGYPRAVGFHDSRLWFAGTRSYPARMWASQVEDYYNFMPGSLDTSGMDLTLAAVQSNDIQWLCSFNRALVVGTSGEEWTVDSGTEDLALTPTSLRARPRTQYGSCGIQPIRAAETLIWCQRDRRKFREFAFRFEIDGYSAPEMTLLAEHISGTGIQQLAYQSSPDPTLWAVRQDGALVGFSYDREQQITAWHRHVTGDVSMPDQFLSVATLHGDYADQIWFVVRRNGQQLIERFNPEQMKWVFGAPRSTLSLPASSSDVSVDQLLDSFMDSQITVTGVSSGGGRSYSIPHLKNRQVVTPGLRTASAMTVPSDGTLQVQNTSAYPTKTLWGLSYSSVLTPTRLDVPLQEGTSLLKLFRLTRMQLKLFRYCGYGLKLFEKPYPADIAGVQDISLAQFERYPAYHSLLTTEGYTGSTDVLSTTFEWTRHPQMTLLIRDAGFVGILGAVLNFDMGGG